MNIVSIFGIGFVTVAIMFTELVHREQQDVKDRVPDGYTIFEQITGDLNKDGIDDLVFILKGTRSDMVVYDDVLDGRFDRNKRGVMVFLRENHGWRLVVQNLDCFLSENENGGVYFAPELSVYIQNGNLYFHYFHGRYGDWKYTFRVNDLENDLELIGYDSTENRGPIILKDTSINFLTKKRLDRVNVDDNPDPEDTFVFEEYWSDVPQSSLLLLSEIEDFEVLFF